MVTVSYRIGIRRICLKPIGKNSCGKGRFVFLYSVSSPGYHKIHSTGFNSSNARGTKGPRQNKAEQTATGKREGSAQVGDALIWRLMKQLLDSFATFGVW